MSAVLDSSDAGDIAGGVVDNRFGDTNDGGSGGPYTTWPLGVSEGGVGTAVTSCGGTCTPVTPSFSPVPSARCLSPCDVTGAAVVAAGLPAVAAAVPTRCPALVPPLVLTASRTRDCVIDTSTS
jgi:hypothetical protein